MIVNRLSGFVHAELSEADHAALANARWRVFSPETVRAIAEVWNGGTPTADMARVLGCSPGSVRILIGRLTQLGVSLRKATGWLVPSKGPRSASPIPIPRLRRAEARVEAQYGGRADLALRRFSWEEGS